MVDPLDPSSATISAAYATALGVPGRSVLVDLDLNSGSISEVVTFEGVINQLARAPDGTLYTALLDPDSRLATVDRATGAITLIGECTTCNIRGLDFDPNGDLYAFFWTSLARISPTTGEALQSVDTSIIVPRGMAFVVPEPGTALMLAFGLGALAWRRSVQTRAS